MGNYYTGDIIARINNKVPKELMDKLIDMSNKPSNEFRIHIIPELTEINDRKWYEYEIDFILSDDLSEEAKEFVKGLGFSLENHDDIFSKLEDYSIHEGYIINIRCCTKRYFVEGIEEKILSLIEELKPYRDDKANYLGRIKDEDFTYEKNLFWDYKEFERTKKDREFVCRGCDKPHENALCDYFNICKRAYDKGYQDHRDKVLNESTAWDS